MRVAPSEPCTIHTVVVYPGGAVVARLPAFRILDTVASPESPEEGQPAHTRSLALIIGSGHALNCFLVELHARIRFLALGFHRFLLLRMQEVLATFRSSSFPSVVTCPRRHAIRRSSQSIIRPLLSPRRCLSPYGMVTSHSTAPPGGRPPWRRTICEWRASGRRLRSATATRRARSRSGGATTARGPAR